MDCVHDEKLVDDFETWSRFFVLPNPVFVALWTFGVCGNIVNVLVFSQRRLRGSAVNSLFWWLSLSDLLELVVLMSLKFITGWCFYLDLSTTFYSGQKYTAAEYFHGRLVGGLAIYLLHAFHVSTVLLNIIMAVLRYLAVRYPLRNLSICNHRSVKRIVIGVYALSFLASSPALFAIILPFELFMNGVGESSISTSQEALDILAIFNQVLVLDSILRVVLFLGLIIASIALIFVVAKTRRGRRRFLVSAQAASDGSKESMKRITNMVIVIVLMFCATDITMTIESVLTFGSIAVGSKVFQSKTLEQEIWYFKLNDKLLSWKIKLASLQWLSVCVNCSYPVFCYFAFCAVYRKKLRVTVEDWYRYFRPLSKRENSRNVTEETTYVMCQR